MTITWFNEHGVTSVPFNRRMYLIDPLGYLDSIRKGGDMWDPQVTDASGRDVTMEVM